MGVAPACGGSSDDDAEAPPVPDGCQPLVGVEACALPFPSDFFRTPDATTRTGVRLSTRGASILHTVSGDVGDPTQATVSDGASRMSTIVAVLPGAVGHAGLPGILDDEQVSVSAASASIVIDADTGARVAHFTDVDPNATEDARRAILIHPLGPLAARHRYVVALAGVHLDEAAGGGLAPPARGFRRLRDRLAIADPALAALRDRFERDVFAPLDRAGVPRASLQLAWDFTTGSDEEPTADLERVAALTAEWLAAGNRPTVVVDEVVDETSPEIWRTVRGKITGPRFVDSEAAGARLVRDAAGAVRMEGTATFPFVAKIPRAASTPGTPPARAVEYGHGFFGSLQEVEDLAQIPDRLRAVVLGIPWWGMTRDDLGVLLDLVLTRPGELARFTDRVHQAMANWLVTSGGAWELLAQSSAFQRADGSSVIAPGPAVFLGISQGHILGGTISAIDPHIARAALQVGGAGVTHMMPRARPFAGIMYLVGRAIPDRLDELTWLALLQRGLDRIDPGTWALRAPPDRRFLLQIGLGDTEAPNLGAFFHARALGIPQLDDGNPRVPGLPLVPAPHDGSAIATYDYGFDLHAIYDAMQAPPSTNEIHEGLRHREAVLAQIARFYEDGVVVNACSDAVCNPD